MTTGEGRHPNQTCDFVVKSLVPCSQFFDQAATHKRQVTTSLFDSIDQACRAETDSSDKIWKTCCQLNALSAILESKWPEGVEQSQDRQILPTANGTKLQPPPMEWRGSFRSRPGVPTEQVENVVCKSPLLRGLNVNTV